jgi:hypothetical protein
MKNRTESSPDKLTSKRKRAFAKYSTARLGRLLSISPRGSAWRRAIQAELRLRLQEAINRIEQEFRSPRNNKTKKQTGENYHD